MFCKNCKKEIANGTLFCSNCGTKTKEEIENKTENTPITWKHWTYLFLGVSIRIFTNGEGFHLLNIEWWGRSFFAILLLFIISGIVAGIIGKSQKKKSIDFTIFSKTLLIISIIFAFGLFYD
jgi:hypothetical protein